MKKIYAILALTLLLAFALGCTKTPRTNPNSDQASSQDTTTPLDSSLQNADDSSSNGDDVNNVDQDINGLDEDLSTL